MGEEIAKWIISEIQKHGLSRVAWGVLAVVAVGVCIGWWLATIKTRREIQALKLEIRKKQGELLSSLAAARQKFNSTRERLGLSLRDLKEAVRLQKDGKKSANDVGACREEICRFYDVDYLRDFCEYIEAVGALCDPDDACHRAKTELTAGLATMSAFVAMVNYPAMLEILGDCTAFRLREASLDGTFFRIRRMVPFWHARTRWKLRRIRQALDPHVRQE